MGEHSISDQKSLQIWTKMLVTFQIIIFGMTLILAMPIFFTGFGCNDCSDVVNHLVANDIENLRENLILSKTKIASLEGQVSQLLDIFEKNRRSDEKPRFRRDSNIPPVLDQSYGVDFGPKTSNESVILYSQWLDAASHDVSGIKGHHMVSAAWSDNEVDSGSGVGPGGNGEALRSGGIGAAMGGSKKNAHFASSHRQSRVSSTAAEFGHGMLIEIPGRMGKGPQPLENAVEAVSTKPVQSYRDYRPPATTTQPPPLATTTLPPPPPPITPTSRTYKRPELKSLGSPSQPPQSSTAVHLIAGAASGGKAGPGVKHSRMHSHWKLSRWSRRLHADRSFPLHRGKVRVNRPGLYLIYAQVSYADQHLEQGYEVMLNNVPMLECTKTRGVGHKAKKLHDISCYTGAVHYIEQGDQIYIRDNHDNRKTIRKPEKSFFGLVKLTSDWMEGGGIF